MAKPPLLSGREVISAFKRKGFIQVAQKGSHVKLQHPETSIVLIIPDHREVDRWTLRSIIRDAKMSVEEFNKLV